MKVSLLAPTRVGVPYMLTKFPGPTLGSVRCALYSTAIHENFCGHKVMAIWKYGKDSFSLLDDHLRQLFAKGCSAKQLSQLDKACKIALVSPGDVFIFSGANPHMVMSVGEALSLTAYESFVNLNPIHTQVLMDTATSTHFEECWPDDDTILDIKEEVADAIEDTQVMIHKGEEPMTKDSKFVNAFNACLPTFWKDRDMKKCLSGRGLAKKC
eukprot:m.46652 g.46652  ORF g.46652 m.46652 type:complete len:212 (-) comp10393_c0_seq5:78-713(-)